MNYFASSDLKNLAHLLKLEDNVGSNEESYECISSTANCHPHLLPHKMKSTSDNVECTKSSSQPDHDTNNIWADDEVLDEEDDETQTKKTPEYEMVYQQSVTPDDIFLQMSGKDPGSNSCESLLVKIKLPEIHSRDEVSLNISALKLICETSKFYLNLDLPKKVDPVTSSAKWDSSANVLAVKLFFDNFDLNI